MLNQLRDSLNFTYRVIEPADKTYGIRVNGEWTGMVGLINRREAFMGAAALTIRYCTTWVDINEDVDSFCCSADRQEAVNFSIPFDFQPYTLMFRRPQELSKALLFIKPFTPLVLGSTLCRNDIDDLHAFAQVWLCLAIALVCIGPILWIIHNLSYYYKVNENGPGGLAKLGNCIWYCYGAVLQQG